ncbi:MAG: glycosyltransferase family 39 protein [Pseudomonadota bacterium]
MQKRPNWLKELCPAVFILAIWTCALLAIDPRGEFMVNDDWGYVKSLQALADHGKIIATGWGHGGPALIVHILWGWLFSSLFGYSMTTLRVSVLVMGVLGSFSLYFLLCSIKLPRYLALLGTLTLILNPLFLSQNFTFMTDITFTSLAAMSLLVLHLGVEKDRRSFIYAGLALATASILTRQIGIVIPLAFMASCWLIPQGRRLGPLRMTIAALLITFVPWLAWESFLSATGSTPVTHHEVFNNIVGQFVRKGWRDYLVFISSELFQVALCYSVFLVSPLVILFSTIRPQKRSTTIAISLYFSCAALFEAAILGGILRPPVVFFRNVITNFGIGPLLFKDTYLLHHARLTTLPTSIYYLLIILTIPMLIFVLTLMVRFIQRLFRSSDISFIGFLSLLSSLLYLGIITLTGFHDRYLIPVCLFFIIWILTEWIRQPESPSYVSLAAALVLLAANGSFAIAGTHDLMATKRAALKAHNYLLLDLKVNPCHVDGGFEFNGYYCYQQNFESKPHLSWWWVDREDYLVALGTLPEYDTVKTYPIERWLGSDGAIYLLKPIHP